MCIVCSISLFSISGSGPLCSLVKTLQKLDYSVSAFSLSDFVCSIISSF